MTTVAASPSRGDRLARQARLADARPGRGGSQPRTPLALGPRERRRRLRQLGLAPDERGVAAAAPRAARARPRPSSRHAATAAPRPSMRDGAERLRPDAGAGQRARALAEQDLAVRGARLEPGRDVQRVAGGERLSPRARPPRTPRPSRRRSGRPPAGRACRSSSSPSAHCVAQLGRGAHRPQRVVLVQPVQPEDADRGVAEEASTVPPWRSITSAHTAKPRSSSACSDSGSSCSASAAAPVTSATTTLTSGAARLAAGVVRRGRRGGRRGRRRRASSSGPGRGSAARAAAAPRPARARARRPGSCASRGRRRARRPGARQR